MRFESIQLDEGIATKLGLEAFRYERLGRIVAFTGPNGGGKTRTLLALQWQLSGLGKLYRDFLDPRANEDGRVFPRRVDPCSVRYREDYAKIKRQVSFGMKLATAMRNKHLWPTIIYLHHRRNSGANGILNSYRGGSSKAAIDTAAHAIYMSSHDDFSRRFPAKIGRGVSYQNMINDFLRLDLTPEYNERGELIGHLSNRPFSGDDLSDGQLRTFGLIETLIDYPGEIRGAILLIDEPETHLHPDVLRKAFDQLLVLEPAQIFLATHSIPLLAHIGIKSVYHLSNGRPKWSGNAPVEMLCGLLGDNDGIAELRTFIDGAASVAFHQFVAESLMPPGVAPYRAEDPQPSQAVNRVRRRLVSEHETHVLDFAAGAGRLIASIANVPVPRRASLEYHVYNDAEHTSAEDHEECRRHLAKLVSADKLDSRYIDDIRTLRNPSFKKMDAVILCNVLHEIDPLDWPRTFQDIAGVLTDHGALLILEDQEMSVGELPHDKGFLVLDKIELQALFGVPQDEAFTYELSHEGRLSLAEISLVQLRRCNKESVCEALRRVRERALKKIVGLRTTGTESHRRGRMHAYYSLLHTNASLALDQLGP